MTVSTRACRSRWRMQPQVLALAALALVLAACSAPRTGPTGTATPAPAAAPTTGSAAPAPAAPSQPTPTVAPLTGRVTRAALETHPGWTDLRAEGYAPDGAAVAAIRDRMPGVEVLVFLGTWCGDSKREMPRFFKIMDQAGIPEAKVTMYGLDRSKKDAEGLTVTYGVQYVPTFIFLKEGREVGRIVEKPSGTLEGDIADILGKASAAS